MSPHNSIPWGAFYTDTSLQLQFPSEWNVEYFNTVRLPQVPDESWEKPVTDILDLVQNGDAKSVTFAVDDLTRPLSYAPFFDRLCNQLNGIDKKVEIKIVFGLGTHRPLSADEMALKTGRSVQNHPSISLHNHQYESDVVETGLTWGKIPIKLNRHFWESDLRVVLSSIVPHPFAGYSGGAKMILPGLSNIEVTQRTHQLALMGLAGKIGDVKKNRFRSTLDELTEKIKVDYFIGFFSNPDRTCSKMLSGPLKETFYSLCDQAESVYGFPSHEISKTYDVVWLNAYPKDSELLQIETAFNPVFSAKNPYWHQHTIFVVSAACLLGMGQHDLFGPGSKLYRPPREFRKLSGHQIWFLIPNMSRSQFEKVFWSGYKLFNRSRDLLLELQQTSAKLNIAVFPTASMQFIRE